MLRLTKSVAAWGRPEFDRVLKQEVAEKGRTALPLQQGLSASSVATDTTPEIMIIRAQEEGGSIQIKIGIFYTGVVAGCSCADDPTPVNENQEYCTAQIVIDRRTAEATVSLLTE